MSDGRAMRLWSAAALLALVAACGQKGPLYLPEPAREVVTRPADTPPAPDAPAPSTSPGVDSPEGPANPAPEVQKPPEVTPDKDKKEPDATVPR